MVDVHLIEASNDQEEHQGVLDVDQEEEEELVKDTRFTVPYLALQIRVGSLLDLAFIVKLDRELAKGPEAEEHERYL